MTTTTLIILNLLMALLALGAVAAGLWIAHHLPARAGAETIRLTDRDAESGLAKAA